MTNLQHKTSKECRKFPDAFTAAKRLWNMPVEHRQMWNVVNPQFTLRGDNTEELIRFLNPLNFAQCLKDDEATLIFTMEEYKAADLPLTKVRINWFGLEPEIKTLFKDKKDAERYLYNVTEEGTQGSWEIL